MNPLERLPAEWCEGLEVQRDPRHRDRYFVSTPFSFGDGDGFTICLDTAQVDQPVLRDLGQTLGHLEDWSWTEARRATVGQLAQQAGAELQGQELRMEVTPNRSLLWPVVEFLRLLNQVDGLPDQVAQQDDHEARFGTKVREAVRAATPFEVEDRWKAPQDVQGVHTASFAIARPQSSPLVAFTASTTLAFSRSAAAAYQYRDWGVDATWVAIVDDMDAHSSRELYRLQLAFDPANVRELPSEPGRVTEMLVGFGAA